MSGIDLGDYLTVPERMVQLKERFPEATLSVLDPARPYDIVQAAGDTYVVVTAACYRTPGDERPGIGIAWEVYPGRTPYTKGSELQNAQTSAWGRAIAAALACDVDRGIASREEVQRAREAQDAPAPARQAAPARQQPATQAPQAERTGPITMADAYRDIINNPGGWFDNRDEKASGKKSSKFPDFKAKRGNAPFDSMGDRDGQPDSLALWINSAPDGFAEALAARDAGAHDAAQAVPISDEPEATGRGATREEAEAALGGTVIEESSIPPGLEEFSEEPF